MLSLGLLATARGGGRTWREVMKSQKMRLRMKLIVPVVAVFWSFSVVCLSAMAQNSSNGAEIEKLKLIVDRQQKALEQQQTQIQALQSALTEQKEMLVSLVQGATHSDTANPPIYPKTDNHLQAQNNHPPFQGNSSRLLPSRRKSRRSCSVVRKLPT